MSTDTGAKDSYIQFLPLLYYGHVALSISLGFSFLTCKTKAEIK